MKTRKELVLDLLKQRENVWVDGPEIANERVGGSEGLKRLRELRQEGHDIRMRKHPDARRDIFQYKLTTGGSVAAPPAPYIPDKPYERAFPLARNDDGSFEIAELICTQCGNAYKDIQQHLTGPEHKAWKERQNPPTPKLIDPPPEPTYTYKEKPKTMEFGMTIPCPRCGGRITKRSPQVSVDPTYTTEPCRRCKGIGVIPNIGPA